MITNEMKDAIRESLKDLTLDVSLEVYTKTGVNDAFNAATREFVETIAQVAPMVKPAFLDIDGDRAAERGVSRTPTLLVAPETYSIRMTGAPLGEEARALVVALLMAGTRSVILSEDSVAALGGLNDSRQIRVFVSPT